MAQRVPIPLLVQSLALDSPVTLLQHESVSNTKQGVIQTTASPKFLF